MTARPRLARPSDPVEAEQPLSKRRLEEVVQTVATLVQQARRREADDGSVTLTFTREADARLSRMLDRIYGRK